MKHAALVLDMVIIDFLCTSAYILFGDNAYDIKTIQMARKKRTLLGPSCA